MNSENRRSVTSIGITSFVLIFVMLCLLTFSVLSLATARADLRLSQRSADRTTAYYDAENRANDILLEIIFCMEDCLSETGGDTDMEEDADAASFYTSVRDSLEGQNGITFTGERTLQYSVPLEDEQLLRVSLELSFEPYEDGSRYKILEWRTESTHEWDSDETLPLLDEDSLSGMVMEE